MFDNIDCFGPSMNDCNIECPHYDDCYPVDCPSRQPEEGEEDA